MFTTLNLLDKCVFALAYLLVMPFPKNGFLPCRVPLPFLSLSRNPPDGSLLKGESPSGTQVPHVRGPAKEGGGFGFGFGGGVFRG